MRLRSSLAGLGLGIAGMLVPATAAEPQADVSRIQHIVVLYLENHSFDNLYGEFPNADGLSHSGDAAIQVNATDFPYQKLPPVLDFHKTPPIADERFPVDLPNQPFNLTRYITSKDTTPDLVHRFYQEQEQIDGGRMDKYVLYSGAGALPLGYYDGSSLPMMQYAEQYVLGDHMFHAAFGGSFLNHIWLICACTPVFPGAPADLVAQLDGHGGLVKDGAVTPDGFAVNTLFPATAPNGMPGNLPPQTLPTIGDRLSEKNVSWAWYAGGYDAALAGHPDALFEVHHQPFLYFSNFLQGTKGATVHLKDEADFIKAIDGNTLPAVSFWKPIGEDDEHPGYANLLEGDQRTADIVKRIHDSPAWDSTVIIVTYDENGGWWDHVPPPAGDRWGPGTRVPLIVISPFAKAKYIDHTVYDTTSILRLIELRYGLEPLGTRDARANSMLNALVLPRIKH